MSFEPGCLIRCIRNEGFSDQITVGSDYVFDHYSGTFANIKANDNGRAAAYDNSRFVLVTNTARLGDTPEQIAVHKELLERPRGSDLFPATPSSVRTFGTGATRDLDANKLDFEGFLSPLVLERYAQHMHKARRMPDGSMRDSDNWQLGISRNAYMKSMWRHFFDVWKAHRGLKVTEVVRGETVEKDIETELCALIFNASGLLHEVLKGRDVT